MEEQVEDSFINGSDISVVDQGMKTVLNTKVNDCSYDSKFNDLVRNEMDVKPKPDDIKFEELIIKTEPFKSVNGLDLSHVKEECDDETKYPDLKITTEYETDETTSTTTISEHVKTDDIDIKDEPVELPSISFTEHGTIWTDNSDKICEQKDLLRKEIVHLTGDNPTNTEVYTCDTCGYKTKNKYSIKYHMLVHRSPSEVPMHRCTLCNYESIYKRYLSRHMLIHSSEKKMFQCDLCDHKSFRKIDLKRHSLIHKDPSEADMYECDKCDFKTKHRDYLKKHQRNHDDPLKIKRFKCSNQLYKCGFCEFATKYKGSLNTHVLIHKDPSEIKMYRCIICGFKTKRKAYIKIHALKCRKINNV